MKKFLLVLLILFLVVIGGFFAATENYVYPFPYIDTQFADTFSWEKYQSISADMSQKEVETRLGKPLSTYLGFGGYVTAKTGDINLTNCWTYTDDGGKYSPWDFAWIAVNVCFDENGKVNGKNEVVLYN